MASGKKTAPKAKKGSKSAPARRSAPAPKKASGADKAKAAKLAAQKAAEQKRLQQQREAERKAAEAKRRDAEKAAAEKRAHLAKEQTEKAIQREVERVRKDEQRKAEAALKDLQKRWDTEKREAAKAAEKAAKDAEKQRAAEAKAAEKAAAQAAKDAEKAAGKKKPVAMSSLTATPVIRPLGDTGGALAPPPPPAKPGHVDHQVLSAISYGLFAAVNKAFGFAGQSVVKNASLRILEYGYKKAWLPPKSKEPVRALNEFFGRLETMGYAEKLHVAKRGDNYVLEVHGLADFDALHELRAMHYPLLPIFLGEMLSAIVDQYFHMVVTMEPLELNEQKRGMNIPFSLHERPTAPEVSRLPAMSRRDDFEE